jgi:hypothetical protein
MNTSQLNRLININRKPIVQDPRITYVENELIIESAKITTWEYVFIPILIFAPGIILFYDNSIFTIIAIALWILTFIYSAFTLYSNLNDVRIDFNDRSIHIIPNSRWYGIVFNTKLKKIDFLNIKSIGTKCKPITSRGEKISKTLFIVLANNKKHKLIGFKDSVRCDNFAELLGELLKVPLKIV